MFVNSPVGVCRFGFTCQVCITGGARFDLEACKSVSFTVQQTTIVMIRVSKTMGETTATVMTHMLKYMHVRQRIPNREFLRRSCELNVS